ncbi:MAG: polysaccharide deacetylase family protein [Christensenellaceae bacterium]
MIISSLTIALICLLIACAGQNNVLVCSLQKRQLPIYCVDRSDNKIAISFDCAWGTEYTDEILGILRENEVKATFFMVEFWVTKHSDYVAKIASENHSIGTHSKTHKHMPNQSSEEVLNELKSSKCAIENVTGKSVSLFRAPFGDYDDKLIKTAESLSLYTIQWDVDSLDWKDISAAQIVDRVVSKTKSGSIILCHNNGKNTAKALGEIIRQLKNKGFEFVTIDELIYKQNYQIDANGRQHTLS